MRLEQTGRFVERKVRKILALRLQYKYAYILLHRIFLHRKKKGMYKGEQVFTKGSLISNQRTISFRQPQHKRDMTN